MDELRKMYCDKCDIKAECEYAYELDFCLGCKHAVECEQKDVEQCEYYCTAPYSIDCFCGRER